jgi:hypothetical protein
MEATKELRNLRKRFGSTVALDGLSFTVTPAQVTAWVDPIPYSRRRGPPRMQVMAPPPPPPPPPPHVMVASPPPPPPPPPHMASVGDNDADNHGGPNDGDGGV